MTIDIPSLAEAVTQTVEKARALERADLRALISPLRWEAATQDYDQGYDHAIRHVLELLDLRDKNYEAVERLPQHQDQVREGAEEGVA